MPTTIRYVLLCALRDRLFPGLILGTVLIALIANLLGGTAFLEGKEMALAYSAAASRLMLALGMTVFVCFHLRSAFDNREIDVILSRPVSRAGLAGAYWAGFAVASFGVVLPVAAALALTGPLSWPGYAAFVASLLLELWFVVALSLFASFTLKSPVISVLASLGLYLLSRMMAFFVMAADSPMGATGTLLDYCRKAVTFIAMLVPRLDFFAKSEWLIYGAQMREWQLFALQAAIFIPLLLVAAIIDFRRKQF